MDVLLDIDLSGGRRQGIERALRAAIRDGRLVAGTPLPSTRVLAADLGVARGTVVDAYDQLVAEGFLSAPAGGPHGGRGIGPPARRTAERAGERRTEGRPEGGGVPAGPGPARSPRLPATSSG